MFPYIYIILIQPKNMGRTKGNVISGKVGHMIGRNVGDEQIWTGLGKVPNQTEATKKSAALFGINSTLASYIRNSVCYNSARDRTMISRLTSATYAIVRHCHDKETNSFTFKKNSFNRLDGFEFNLNSPLIDSLWVKPKLTILDKKLIVVLPEINVPKELKFPAKTISCSPLLDVFLYTPAEGYFWFKSHEIEEISNVKAIIPAQEFIVDIPQGCIALVGLSLFYFSKEYNVKKMINSRDFSPAGISGVIINPGTCDLQDIISRWEKDLQIKLRKTTFIDSEDSEAERSDASPLILKTPGDIVRKSDSKKEQVSQDPNPLFAVATNLREMGMQDQDIAKATGLTMEEIADL